jgi:hypothetical protein
MKINKYKRIYICIFFSIFILNCGKSKEEINQDKEIENNKSKFYCPDSYDDFWNVYDPKLVDSEGWIESNCADDLNERIKVKVVSQNLRHKGWGKFEGNLKVKKDNSDLMIEIKFECFTPNYEIGEWLNK